MIQIKFWLFNALLCRYIGSQRGSIFKGPMMKARIGALACLSALSSFTGFHKALAFEGAPRDWQMDLSPSATPVMDSMRNFNTLLLVIIVAIVVLVFGLLAWVMI